jgi:hypothetical protein
VATVRVVIVIVVVAAVRKLREAGVGRVPRRPAVAQPRQQVVVVGH